MTDEQIAALVARLRSVDISWSETGEWCAEAADLIEAQAAEIEKLAGLVRIWHYLAVGPDEMGDYHTQKALIRASEPYAHPALKALAQEQADD